MHISDQLLSQRLFQGFVFLFMSVEKPISHLRKWMKLEVHM